MLGLVRDEKNLMVYVKKHSVVGITVLASLAQRLVYVRYQRD